MKNLINLLFSKVISVCILLFCLYIVPYNLFSQTANAKKPYLVKNSGGASSITIAVSGVKVEKEYIGYKDTTEDITPEISVQVKYDDTYRASAIQIQRFVITGLSGKEYPAFHIITKFGNNLQPNINNYEEFLKVLYKPSANSDHSLYSISDHKFRLIKSYKAKELANGKFNLDTALRFTKDGGAGLTLDKGLIALIPDSEVLAIEKISFPENLSIYTIATTGEPFDSWMEEQNISPDSHLDMTGTPPHIVNYTDGKTLTVAWMESNGSKVHIQEFNSNFEPTNEYI